MDNSFGLTEDDLKSIINVLQNQPLVKEAIIFGSRAKGNYKNGSDIDIALKGTNLNFETVSRIGYLLNEETQMPYKFDIINYSTIDNKDLVEHIDRIGISFYKAAN